MSRLELLATGDVAVGVLDRSELYLVVALIVVPLLVLSALLLRVVRRRARAAGDALRAELEADPPVLGPEQAGAPDTARVPDRDRWACSRARTWWRCAVRSTSGTARTGSLDYAGGCAPSAWPGSSPSSSRWG